MKAYFSVVISLMIISTILFYPCHGQKLDIEVKTSSYGGINSGGDTLDNVAVIWIQTPDSQFIKTVMVWSETGFDFMLRNWRLLSGITDSGYYDGVTSATRDDHSEDLKASWDCMDTSGTKVPAGTYEYWIEMNEHDYWWGQVDPNEVYPGKVTKGTIEIDFTNEKLDTGTAIDNIFDIYAEFDPTVGIIVDAPEKQSKAVSFSYNPVSRQLMMKLGTLSSHSGIIRIYDLRGALLRTISFAPNTKIVNWDGKNSAGYLMPSGVYIFEIKATDSQIKSSVYSVRLFK